ncbi:MAG: hypothetical protein DRG66_05610 [Deltaproteobacteria bacterium]|nr:MAG: hypothetical protein DRG66_05610 [Deltaproteobacteria bacterium]
MEVMGSNPIPPTMQNQGVIGFAGNSFLHFGLHLASILPEKGALVLKQLPSQETTVMRSVRKYFYPFDGFSGKTLEYSCFV